MNTRPYSSYHGRGGAGRRILIAIVVLLVIALALAVVALFVLPNYIVYTADGPQLVLPLFNSTPAPASSAAPEDTQAPQGDAELVIEVPEETPSAAPTPPADLSAFPRREAPLGLPAVTVDQLLSGQDQGCIVAMTDFDLAQADETLGKAVLAAPYAAAYLAPDWSQVAQKDFSAHLTQRCTALAGAGFDELLFSSVPTDVDQDALAKCYNAVFEALDQAGWQGRLSLVVNQDLYNTPVAQGLQAAMGSRFQRFYFLHILRDDVSYSLRSNGFSGTPRDIVSVYATTPTVTWAWAVLPQ